mgnify:CR=1 FL=1
MQHSTEHETIFLGNLWIDKKIPPLEYVHLNALPDY